jgi:hypothetical protein
MINGRSANVSITLSHLDFPLATNQAKGKPATKSRKETRKAIANEAYMADDALDIRLGFWKISLIVLHLRIMPKMGGTRIIPKKKITEIK